AAPARQGRAKVERYAWERIPSRLECVRFLVLPRTARERSRRLYHSLSLQTFCQPLARPAETHVHRRRVDGQQACDLVGIVVQRVAEGKDLPIPLRHLFEYVSQPGEGLFLLQPLQR